MSALAVGADPPADNAPPLSEGTTAQGRFVSRLVVEAPGAVAARYESALRARYGDGPDGEAAHAARQHSALRDGYVTVDAGEDAGDWRFFWQDGAVPTRAWRDIDRSGEHGYDAERIGYCSDAPADCEAWFEAERHRSPKPSYDAGVLARMQWESRVLQEPCRPGPDHLPSEAPLSAAFARSGLNDARVVLRLTLSPCGDPRSVGIVTSSGNRDIDRAAMSWARRARFASTTAGTGGGAVGNLPIRLSMPEPEPPTQTPAAP